MATLFSQKGVVMVGKTRVSIPVVQGANVTGIQSEPSGEKRPYFSLQGYETDAFTIQATVKGTGVVSAEITLQFSNDLIGWIEDSAAKFSLSGTDVATQGIVSGQPWIYFRVNITSLAGTDAKVYVTVGG